MKKIVLFSLCLMPVLYLAWSVQEANDPIKYIYTYTGFSAIVFLILSLSISPLKKIVNLIKYRKMLGLFSLFYASLHVMNFILLDAQIDFDFIAQEVFKKQFIFLGAVSYLILIFMGFTSTKKLFAKYNRWHKLVYIALILALIHESAAQKVLGVTEYSLILIGVLLFGIRGFMYKVK
jgi:sulfoxide reductase heme-binding subunit YedZ